MEPIGQVQVLGNEHDLREGQRVDQRESMKRVINVVLGEDQGLEEKGFDHPRPGMPMSVPER